MVDFLCRVEVQTVSGPNVLVDRLQYSLQILSVQAIRSPASIRSSIAWS